MGDGGATAWAPPGEKTVRRGKGDARASRGGGLPPAPPMRAGGGRAPPSLGARSWAGGRGAAGEGGGAHAVFQWLEGASPLLPRRLAAAAPRSGAPPPPGIRTAHLATCGGERTGRRVTGGVIGGLKKTKRRRVRVRQSERRPRNRRAPLCPTLRRSARRSRSRAAGAAEEGRERARWRSNVRPASFHPGPTSRTRGAAAAGPRRGGPQSCSPHVPLQSQHAAPRTKILHVCRVRPLWLGLSRPPPSLFFSITLRFHFSHIARPWAPLPPRHAWRACPRSLLARAAALPAP